MSMPNLRQFHKKCYCCQELHSQLNWNLTSKHIRFSFFHKITLCYSQLSPKVVILRFKRSKFSWKVTAHYGLWEKTDWHPINENLYWWMEAVPKIGKKNSQIRNPNQIILCNFLRRYAGIICIYFCCKLNVKSVFLLLGVLVLWRSAHFRICLHPSISPFPSLSISTFLKVKTFNIMEK